MNRVARGLVPALALLGGIAVACRANGVYSGNLAGVVTGRTATGVVSLVGT